MITSKQTPSKYFFFLRNHILRKKLILTSKTSIIKNEVTISNEKNRIIRKLNPENNLNKNWSVLQVLQTYTSMNTSTDVTKSSFDFLKKPMLFKYTPIYLSLTKEFALLKWEKKRQLFFFFNELLFSLDNSNKTLLKEMSFFFDQKNAYSKEKLEILLFENYLHNIFYGKESKLTYGTNSRVLNSLFLKITQNLLISNTINLMSNKMLKHSEYIPNKLEAKMNVLDIMSFWHLNFDKWELYGLPIAIRSNFNLNEDTQHELTLKRNKLISVLKRRTKIIPQISLRNYNVFVNKTNFMVKSFIWKAKSNFTSNNFFDSIAKLSRLYNKEYNLSNKKTPFQVLYLISRIEEKISYYTKLNNKSTILPKLIRLRNLFLFLIQEKKMRTMNESILTTKVAITRIKNKTWKLKLLSYLQNYLVNTSIEKNVEFYNFINLIYNRLSFGRKNVLLKSSSGIIPTPTSKSFIFGTSISRSNLFKGSVRKNFSDLRVKSWTNKIVNIKRNWVGSKLVLAEKHLTFTQKKTILSSWINRPVDLFFINALSLTKFAFKNERFNSPNNNPNTFLSVLDRDFINKYKYIGIYIKDLVRVAFISVFFKKPSFLAKFMAFQLSRLPRNRKETNFVRFLIKVIKTFAAERKEILGVRIRFKGRVNRWRRTKFILGNRGTLPLQTISERIEQGTAQAVNKKGAVGIRIWLRYKQSFSFILKDHILKYMNYSKALRVRKITRSLVLK